MKKIIILLVLTTILLNSFSQKMPLRGSGKTVNQTFQLDGFYKINLLDLDGVVEVVVGKEFSVNAIIDDNLAPLLDASVDNGTLTVQLKGNLYNKLYIEETNIKIKITLPEVSVIKHRSNGKLIVDSISGRYFGIINAGNGSAYIIGSVNELNIT
jgi:Putative auto-transporter adhesin, head GIN domain